MSRISPQVLLENMTRVRRSKVQVYTNYALQPTVDVTQGIVGENTVVFLKPTEGSVHPVFVSTDLNELSELLQRVTFNIDARMSCITRGEMPVALHNAVSKSLLYLGKSEKFKNASIDEDFDEDIRGFHASNDDLPGIYNLLGDCHSEPLDGPPNRDELADMVRRGQVLVLRQGGQVMSVLCYAHVGRVAFIKCLKSRTGDLPYKADLLQAFCTEIKKLHVRQSFAWVRDDKSGLRKIYADHGYLPDQIFQYQFASRS